MLGLALFYFVFQLLLHIFIYALGSSSQVIHFCYRPSIHPTILQFKTIIIISRHNDLMQNEMKKKYKRRNKREVFLLSGCALSEFGSLVKGIRYLRA